MTKKAIKANEIPRVLRILRNMRNLSQSQLAAKLGVDTSTLAKYETGAIQLTHQKVEQIAEVLGVDVMEIMTFDVNKFLGKGEESTNGNGQKVDPHVEATIKAKDNEILMLKKMVDLMEEKEDKELKKSFQKHLLDETQIDTEKFEEMMKKVKQNNYKIPVTMKKPFFQVLETVATLMKK